MRENRDAMTVNFKLLKSFVTAVETRSLSAAATSLRVAQPALSQQIAALESHFKQKLLIRSNAGVTPTDAGHELYRHAVLILGQLEQAELEVARKGSAIAGTVSVGLATYSTTSTLSTALLKAVRHEYPNVHLFINDNFGLVLSEMVMTGRMDMAIIYAPAQMKGVTLQPILIEELFFIAPDLKLMAASVQVSGSAFESGSPTALFQTRIVTGENASLKAQYTVSRDGRFLINMPVDESPTPITMILNWHPGLSARENR